MTVNGCINCGAPREKGRRVCRPCYLQKKRESAKKQYEEVRKFLPRYGLINCQSCFKEIKSFRPTQKLCRDCLVKQMSTGDKATNNYTRAKGNGYAFLHRRIAEKLLGRKLTYNEVVHHIDENPNNNSLDNLMVMSRSIHGKLHVFLRSQRALLEQSNIVNAENCWENFIVPITTAWLETTSAKVIRISEISQSAAEPLSD